MLDKQRTIGTHANSISSKDRIVEHYALNTQTKVRLQWLIYAHFLLACLVVCQLMTYHLSLVTVISIPRPHLWQYIWLVSLVPSIVGLMSMKSNNPFLMRIFFRGTITFGLAIITTTIVLNLNELFNYKRLKVTRQFSPPTFLGLPLLILWYIFLIITVEIHAFSLYMAHSLLNTWQYCHPVDKQH
jgi:hypothetical protein